MTLPHSGPGEQAPRLSGELTHEQIASLIARIATAAFLLARFIWRGKTIEDFIAGAFRS